MSIKNRFQEMDQSRPKCPVNIPNDQDDDNDGRDDNDRYTHNHDTGDSSELDLYLSDEDKRFNKRQLYDSDFIDLETMFGTSISEKDKDNVSLKEFTAKPPKLALWRPSPVSIEGIQEYVYYEYAAVIATTNARTSATTGRRSGSSSMCSDNTTTSSGMFSPNSVTCVIGRKRASPSKLEKELEDDVEINTEKLDSIDGTFDEETFDDQAPFKSIYDMRDTLFGKNQVLFEVSGNF